MTTPMSDTPLDAKGIEQAAKALCDAYNGPGDLPCTRTIEVAASIVRAYLSHSSAFTQGVEMMREAEGEFDEAFSKATGGLWWHDGDTADVFAEPEGSTFVNDRKLIAKCACGDDWHRNANFIVKAQRLARLRSLPAPDSGNVPAGCAEREALRSALTNLCMEMSHMLRTNPKKDGGLYRQRLEEGRAALRAASPLPPSQEPGHGG